MPLLVNGLDWVPKLALLCSACSVFSTCYPDVATYGIGWNESAGSRLPLSAHGRGWTWMWFFLLIRHYLKCPIFFIGLLLSNAHGVLSSFTVVIQEYFMADLKYQFPKLIKATFSTVGWPVTWTICHLWTQLLLWLATRNPFYSESNSHASGKQERPLVTEATGLNCHHWFFSPPTALR